MSPEPESELELPSLPSYSSEPEPELGHLNTHSPPTEPEPELPESPSRPTTEPVEQPSRKRKLRLILPSPPPSPEGDTPLPSPRGDDDVATPEEDESELPTVSSWSGDLPERPRKRVRTRTTPVTNPTKPYKPPTAYAKAMARLMDVNQVREYQRAEILFRSARHPIHGSVFADACKKELGQILEAGPSEAIEAKCYMMLARRELRLDAFSRVSYAEDAVHSWKRVIGRKGISKFPIAKARKGLKLAEELQAHIEEAVAQEESSDIL